MRLRQHEVQDHSTDKRRRDVFGTSVQKNFLVGLIDSFESVESVVKASLESTSQHVVQLGDGTFPFQAVVLTTNFSQC